MFLKFSDSPIIVIFAIVSVLGIASARPQQTISLEYKPNRPFYYPRPGYRPGQIIPEGEPWPANAASYANFSQTSPRPTVSRPPPVLLDLDNRNKETNGTTTTTTATQSNRPSFHPSPGNNVAPIVPPGEPWPANAEDYANFSQTSPQPIVPTPVTPPVAVNLDNRNKETNGSAPVQSNRPSFHPNPGNNVGQIIPPGKPWPANAEDYANFSQTSPQPIVPTPVTPPVAVNLDNRNQETNGSAPVQSMRPSFHPNPGNNVGQIIPPGKPWPANVEDYANFSQTGSQPNPAVSPQVVNLDNRNQNSDGSNRPSFHPNPGNNVGQIVPPGKPWPANAEDYANFSQTSPRPIAPTPAASPQVVNLDNRNQNNASGASRPSFHPNPGNNVGQIVPPGKPWPANAEDYANFSQTTSRPISAQPVQSVNNRMQNSTVVNSDDNNAESNVPPTPFISTEETHNVDLNTVPDSVNNNSSLEDIPSIEQPEDILNETNLVTPIAISDDNRVQISEPTPENDSKKPDGEVPIQILENRVSAAENKTESIAPLSGIYGSIELHTTETTSPDDTDNKDEQPDTQFLGNTGTSNNIEKDVRPNATEDRIIFETDPLLGNKTEPKPSVLEITTEHLFTSAIHAGTKPSESGTREYTTARKATTKKPTTTPIVPNIIVPSSNSIPLIVVFSKANEPTTPKMTYSIEKASSTRPKPSDLLPIAPDVTTEEIPLTDKVTVEETPVIDIENIDFSNTKPDLVNTNPNPNIENFGNPSNIANNIQGNFGNSGTRPVNMQNVNVPENSNSNVNTGGSFGNPSNIPINNMGNVNIPQNPQNPHNNVVVNGQFYGQQFGPFDHHHSYHNNFHGGWGYHGGFQNGGYHGGNFGYPNGQPNNNAHHTNNQGGYTIDVFYTQNPKPTFSFDFDAAKYFSQFIPRFRK